MPIGSGPSLFEPFQVWYNAAFEDAGDPGGWDQLPGLLSLHRTVYLRGSTVVADPATDSFTIRSVAGIESLLTTNYADQFLPWTYATFPGLVTLDYEPFNNASIPAAATIETTRAALKEGVEALKSAMPAAQVSLWGIPTSPNWESTSPPGVIYGQDVWGADGLWDAVDFLEPHVYSGGGDAGTHDGGNGSATLTDSGANWTEGELVGATVQNTDDGSHGLITANTATTVTATLAGGTENHWDAGDSYDIPRLTSGVISTTTTRINEALEVGKPVRASFFPQHTGPTGPFWSKPDVLAMAKLCRDLGCFAFSLWEAKNLAEGEAADYWTRLQDMSDELRHLSTHYHRRNRLRGRYAS